MTSYITLAENLNRHRCSEVTKGQNYYKLQHN